MGVLFWNEGYECQNPYKRLCVIISVYARRLNIKSVLYDYMCMLTQYFTQSTNTQENGNAF